ncbi:autotransporter assembly complex family protein [Fretibacter rubidus]|uniref:autotransporter assembly complex protein TamA n=1 Tax=Fretibacter rubidus TaxID=570162 RepID=UPI00352A6F4C
MYQFFTPFRRLIYALALVTAWGATAWAQEPLATIKGDMTPEVRDLVLAVLGTVETPPRSLAQARRRAKGAAEQARSVMRSQGYYAAEITARVEEAVATNKESSRAAPEVILTIIPNSRFSFTDVSINYPDGPPDIATEVQSVINLPDGAPGVAAKVVAAEIRMINLLRAKGYPSARALPRDAVVDYDNQTLSVKYNISTGVKTRFGDIVQTGTASLAKGWPTMIAPFEAGEVFDDRQMNRLAARVIGTGVFDGATATLSDDVVPNVDGTVTRNVMLNVEQGAINTVRGELGYSTTEGSGIDLVYERRNFIGYAQTLRLLGTAKTNEISAGVAYNIPFAWRVDRELDLGLSVASENTDAFDGERASVNAVLTQKFAPFLKVAGGLSLEASRFEDDGQDVTSYLVDGILRASYDSRNNLFNPVKGVHAELDVTPTYNFGKADGFFTTAEASLSHYQRMGDRLVAAGRLKAGTIFGASQASVPLNRRYYAGGGGSVRGFGFQSISPRDAEGEIIGGRSVLEGSAELRYRGNGALGFVGFVDAGSVTRADVPDFTDIRYGAGVGVRYYTSFAPLRADIAIPINKRDGDNAVQIYISIGQAF